MTAQQPWPQQPAPAPYPAQQPIAPAVAPPMAANAPPAGQGLAMPLMVLLGICAAFPLFAWVLMRIIPVGVYEAFGPAVSWMVSGVEGLIFLVAFIVFLVWFYKFYGGLRAAGAATRFSPGMAVVGWFIPFANFVLPAMAVKDAMRVATNGQRGGGLVVGWWLLWLATTVLRMADSALWQSGFIDPGLAIVATILFWLKTLAVVGAFGLWLAVVRTLVGAMSQQGQQPAAAPAYGYGQ